MRYVVVLLVLVCAELVNVSAEHAWNDFHWARAGPFTVEIGHSRLASAWLPYLNEAAADWSQSAVLDIVRTDAQPRHRKGCWADAGRIEACSGFYGTDVAVLGTARVWLDRESHITQALVSLNDSYFTLTTYDTPAWRRTVMCQEVGHTVGLDHQDEDFDNVNIGSCMDYARFPEGPLSNEHPNAHDFEQLGIIYSHFDSATTVGATRPLRLPPASWGRLVRSSHDGRVQMFEAHDNYGRILTRVLWADLDADARW